MTRGWNSYYSLFFFMQTTNAEPKCSPHWFRIKNFAQLPAYLPIDIDLESITVYAIKEY